MSLLSTCLVLGNAVGVPPAVVAQDLSSNATVVYQRAAPSVFLVEVRDDRGEQIGLGSAFVVEGGKLITNAHVIEEGTPFLRTGAAAIRLTVERVSYQADLALLSAPAGLEASGLRISGTSPAVGSRVFAIGNPRGLERSISEGIISGFRELRGGRWLQMTAAVSSGSSGGPIVDASGEVVGVTVATLDDGQNLNFAIPVERVADLMSSPTKDGSSQALDRVRVLALEEIPPYGDSVAWEGYEARFKSALAQASDEAVDGEDLLELATLAHNRVFSDEAVALAEQAIRVGVPDSDSARIVMLSAWTFEILFAETNGLHENPIRVARFLEVADEVAEGRPQRSETHLFRARALALLPGRDQGAVEAARTALNIARASGSVPGSTWRSVHSIIGEIGSPEDDDTVFADLVDAGAASTYTWASHGNHLNDRGAWNDAGDAFTVAYALSEDPVVRYVCEAGEAYFLAESYASALESFRACIDEYALAAAPDPERVATAHLGAATILVERGVYGTAEAHARQALRIDPNDPWAPHTLSQALLEQERYSEAAAAAEEAIRLSDGAYSTMHFAAGSAYFEMADWSRCARAFQLADELNPDSRDTAALYNAALCLARQGFFRDAAQTMERVLKRDPNRPNRADLEVMIRRWRGG